MLRAKVRFTELAPAVHHRSRIAEVLDHLDLRCRTGSTASGCGSPLAARSGPGQPGALVQPCTRSDTPPQAGQLADGAHAATSNRTHPVDAATRSTRTAAKCGNST
jgi:hypothetical protein